MRSGVEKVDSAEGGSQHTEAGQPRQLRALSSLPLVAALAAATLAPLAPLAPLAAQQESPRVVRGLSFEGNHALDDYTLTAAIATTTSSASATTVVSWLRNRGYPYADVLKSFDVDVAALAARVTLEGVPGPRLRIGEVIITGAERVDTATVRRMLSVNPHDWFRQDQLYQTQRDLYGLGMFRSVSVVLADTAPRAASDSTVAVLVRLSEAPLHRVLLGAGYGSLDCFRVQTGWTAYDFLGGARALDITAQ